MEDVGVLLMSDVPTALPETVVAPKNEVTAELERISDGSSVSVAEDPGSAEATTLEDTLETSEMDEPKLIVIMSTPTLEVKDRCMIESVVRSGCIML